MLWLCAGACAAVVFTGIAGLCFPGTGIWLHTSSATLTVEATALIGVGVFAFMAIKAAKRARYGSSDSIWSYATSSAFTNELRDAVQEQLTPGNQACRFQKK
ncbi:MAG: hypothetical protein NVV73_07385 [Cellvibrionaceae bacterium]|nr:hypothetical protein [Cellvibrionaceae bacterium]